MPLRMDVKAKPTDPVVARWADGYTLSLPQYTQTRLRMFCAFAGRAEDAGRVNALNLEVSHSVRRDMPLAQEAGEEPEAGEGETLESGAQLQAAEGEPREDGGQPQAAGDQPQAAEEEEVKGWDAGDRRSPPPESELPDFSPDEAAFSPDFSGDESGVDVEWPATGENIGATMEECQEQLSAMAIAVQSLTDKRPADVAAYDYWMFHRLEQSEVGK